MKKVLLVIVVIVIAALALGYAVRPHDDSAAVRAAVVAFGSNMQKVSLQASSTQVAENMQQSYASYVDPELLAQWEANPMQAPGRLTSSPWPDHLQVTAIDRRGDGTYEVEGSVVEASSAGTGASYPVALTLAKEGGSSWLITHFEGYPPSQGPAAGPITVTGKMVCLPHKDTSGPQTMECAFGLQDDSGRYYALNDSNPSQNKLYGVPTGARITVEGTFAPRSNSNYQDIGVITVTSVASSTSNS